MYLKKYKNKYRKNKKRFYFTEIVLPLGFADAIFRRERSDDRKCVCCSQAKFRQECKQLNKTTETYKP